MQTANQLAANLAELNMYNNTSTDTILRQRSYLYIVPRYKGWFKNFRTNSGILQEVIIEEKNGLQIWENWNLLPNEPVRLGIPK